jgi:uncharacterized membrane protein
LIGLLLGTLFFAASLTPSLVPRPTFVQGALSGLSLATGYGIGSILSHLWRVIELPEPKGQAKQVLSVLAWVLCAGVAALALWQASGWQDRLRALMDLPPVETARPLTVGLTALAVFVLVVLLGRLVHLTWRSLSASTRSPTAGTPSGAYRPGADRAAVLEPWQRRAWCAGRCNSPMRVTGNTTRFSRRRVRSQPIR